MVYLLFSANTMTGKSAWCHPAMDAWIREMEKLSEVSY
jgi:hypothetical protein